MPITAADLNDVLALALGSEAKKDYPVAAFLYRQGILALLTRDRSERLQEAIASGRGWLNAEGKLVRPDFSPYELANEEIP